MQDKEKEPIGLTISLPLDKVDVGNLTNIIDAKRSLIKKALGVENLDIEVIEATVTFPWFTAMPKSDELKAYILFILSLGKMSKELKLISAKEVKVDNEKYAFNCFLRRLGIIGSEYKKERKILLKNLSGNASKKKG